MDSIKFNEKGHSVEFSKRELTIDNKTYKYTGISQVKHSSAYHAYLFRYNGEWVKLFYDEAHANVIAALFKKINAMNARRAAQARATQSIDTAAIAAALAGQEKAPKAAAQPAEAIEAKKPEVTVQPVKPEPAAQPEVPEVVAEAEAIAQPEVPEPATQPEVPAEAKEPEVVAEPEAAAQPEDSSAETAAETAVVPAETPAGEAAEEIIKEADEAASRKHRLKKAFIVFAIIIALFVIAGIIYFFTMGPTNDASQGLNVDETHQYNDIDELIEEMQED